MTIQARIDRALQDAAAAKNVPGFVALATSAGETIYQGVAGVRDLAQPTPMTLDTVFWIASMTKALTSVAAMQLVQQGKLSLPALKAPKVLDGFDASGAPKLRPARGDITLRHLLTHTAGYGYAMWNPEIRRVQAHFGYSGAPAHCDDGGT